MLCQTFKAAVKRAWLTSVFKNPIKSKVWWNILKFQFLGRHMFWCIPQAAQCADQNACLSPQHWAAENFMRNATASIKAAVFQPENTLEAKDPWRLSARCGEILHVNVEEITPRRLNVALSLWVRQKLGLPLASLITWPGATQNGCRLMGANWIY